MQTKLKIEREKEKAARERAQRKLEEGRKIRRKKKILKYQDSGKVKKLLVILGKEKDPKIRRRCGNAIRIASYQSKDIKKPQVVNLLIDAFKDEDLEDRQTLAVALGNTGSQAAVGPLIDALLNDKDEVVRGWSAEILGNLGDPRAVEPLINVLKDENQILSKIVLSALGEITNRNFNRDWKKWQNWWEENKEEFLKKE